MFLNKDVESWAAVKPDAVMTMSAAAIRNILTMALADIQRLGEELADTKADADAMAKRIQAGDRARDEVIEECAQIADACGVRGKLETMYVEGRHDCADDIAIRVRALKTKPLS